MKRLANTILIILISITGFSFTLINNPYPHNSFLESKNHVKKIEIKTTNNNSDNERELRKVEKFSKINITITGEIFYTQGNDSRIEIEAPEETQANIITEVKNDVLIINFKNKKDTKGEIKIFITSNEIKEVAIVGSANFIAENKVKSKEIEFSIAGSGDIIFKNLDSKEIIAEIAGSGDIVLRGKDKAEKLTVNIAGSGDCSAKKLEVVEAEINIAGSGDCIVNVTKKLEINIAGSGDVRYLGSPKIKSSIIGSGEIKKD